MSPTSPKSLNRNKSSDTGIIIEDQHGENADDEQSSENAYKKNIKQFNANYR